MHNFAKDYLLSWFPKITSYVAFTTRLNRLSEAIKRLCNITIEEFIPKECSMQLSLLDSMPIITCGGKRKGNVAQELSDKSFCSTKNLWYYGVKLHGLSFYNKGTLPYPESIIISKASENDLNVFKENICCLPVMIPRLQKSHDSWVGCLFIIIKIFENI